MCGVYLLPICCCGFKFFNVVGDHIADFCTCRSLSGHAKIYDSCLFSICVHEVNSLFFLKRISTGIMVFRHNWNRLLA